MKFFDPKEKAVVSKTEWASIISFSLSFIFTLNFGISVFFGVMGMGIAMLFRGLKGRLWNKNI